MVQSLAPEYLPSVGVEHSSRQEQRAGRRKARALIADYHERRLLVLLEHVREGFARLDRGEIDAFELDELRRHVDGSGAIYSTSETRPGRSLRRSHLGQSADHPALKYDASAATPGGCVQRSQPGYTIGGGLYSRMSIAWASRSRST